MWQIIEIGLMAGVSLENNPHIAALLEEDEEMSDLQRLGPEAILLRWFNYHLRNDKTYEGPVITNFKSNIKDSIGYCHLLAQIQPDDIMPRIPHNHTANSDAERAEIMLKRADILDCRAFLQPRDILNGTEKLNLAFVANLFNNHPALEAGDIEIIQETREEKTYRNWMNSLGVKPRLVRIYYDIKNGVPLYDIMKQIDPDVVKDSKITVALPPYKKFSQMITQIGNCNQVVELGKKMGFTLIGISGDDIYNENGKLTLALLWQMMRAYSVQVLKKLGDGKPVTDKDILNWVNSKISEHKISSFKDPSITTSLPIYRLINAIRMNTIDFKVVDTRNFDKMDDENKHSNARYALSQARKLGATVYALPDDVTEGNAKMITTVFASLMVLDKQQQQALAQ